MGLTRFLKKADEFEILVQLISKLSSTPQKSRNRFITTFSPCKHAFLKF
jgi:hypothetical protein